MYSENHYFFSMCVSKTLWPFLNYYEMVFQFQITISNVFDFTQSPKCRPYAANWIHSRSFPSFPIHFRKEKRSMWLRKRWRHIFGEFNYNENIFKQIKLYIFIFIFRYHMVRSMSRENQVLIIIKYIDEAFWCLGLCGLEYLW